MEEAFGVGEVEEGAVVYAGGKGALVRWGGAGKGRQEREEEEEEDGVPCVVADAAAEDYVVDGQSTVELSWGLLNIYRTGPRCRCGYRSG